MELRTTKLSENGQTFGYRIAVHLGKKTYEIYLYSYWPFVEVLRFL